MLTKRVFLSVLFAGLLAPLSPAGASTEPSILVYGDSLSAAYGLARNQGWPTLLQDRLRAQGFPHQVVNRSLSGETTFGGRQRFERVLRQVRPSLVVLALGANDALRGLSLAQTRQNLALIIEKSLQQKSSVILVGIRLPPNYGPTYDQQFQAVYQGLSKQYPVRLVPFMLEGFALDESFFQADRIHPNAKAQPLILDTLWPSIQSSLPSPSRP